MHDINRIKDLLSRQETLEGYYEDLDAILDDLKAARKAQEFFPASLSSSISDLLTTIQAEQDSFLKDYKALEFGDTPASVTACKAELDDYLKYIIEKSSFVEIINFVQDLDTDNPDAKADLRKHQEQLAGYNCRIHSVSECETDLKKYILLRKAFEEKDPATRLSSIIELSPSIDFSLVVALNTNALYRKSTAMKEALAVQQGITKEFPAQTDISSSGLISDIFSDLQTPRESYMPDFPVQERIQNRPVPTEYPNPSEEDIEIGLKRELNHVLSREDTSSSLSEVARYTSSIAAATGSKPAEDENLSAWQNLGIMNPAAACFSVPDEAMKIYRCEKPKKFSSADFQKEMSLKSPNRFQKQYAMRDAYKYGATTPYLLAELIKEDPDLVKDACDTLVDSGYLKAFRLLGPSYRNFDKLYVLTASGRHVFTNADSAATLNLPAVEKASTPPFSSHADPVLNRQLFLHSKKLMELYMPSRQFGVGSFILETNSFINFFPTTNNTGTYSYVSVFGKNLKDYLIFKVELQEMLPTLDVITVVGMTPEHAYALTEWISQSFADSLQGKILQYYVYGTDTYHAYPSGRAIR